MADLKKCDRCGKICGKIISADQPTTNGWGMVDVRINNESVWTKYDLCKKCLCDFSDFMTEKRV